MFGSWKKSDFCLFHPHFMILCFLQFIFFSQDVISSSYVELGSFKPNVVLKDLIYYIFYQRSLENI